MYSQGSCSSMAQLSHQAAALLEDFCYLSADSCRNICILPGCWCPSAGAELGWEDAVLFHRCWKRRELAHELLVCSWAKSEHVGRERREAQKSNEFSRGRRRINLPSRRSLTGKLCITVISHCLPLPSPFSCPVHTSGSLCTFSQSLPAC